MKVLGIAGTDGSGKSTLRNALVRPLSEQGFSVMFVPFAGQLRLELTSAMEWDWRNRNLKTPIPNAWEKPTPRYMRDLLRGWGEMKRQYDPDYWVVSWRTRVEDLRRHDGYQGEVFVIADDVRYVNEVTAVQGLGGQLLYLDDVSVPDNELLHELVDVRTLADIGFSINSKRMVWADPQAVLVSLGLV